MGHEVRGSKRRMENGKGARESKAYLRAKGGGGGA